MDGIIQVTGKVKYPITIDPSVWIFDDRRIDLDTYFDVYKRKDNSLADYTKSVSKQWDKEITEGAQIPETGKKKFEKQKVLEGTFGMKLGPFLHNSEPDEDAEYLLILADGQEYRIPLEESYGLIACFSKKGKPLRGDGPIHLYFSDGSNKENPIKKVASFKVI
ncbi:peptidyl-prolyl cis-trans isomerase [Neobacillus notoginsengisoli]|uniref:Peptidyl-prolyl cis-trans isomerase n=1 Tax=Neobacillus notoginsengisoli TaxID=1578198 RepID=A0A417YR66_9BACI|nr:peptidyl-prolyl cis-trans isomerase [Neobacillus notoginsengisoli]RHW36545.1 peptidyl-prolyl cis-trans isomerase [Neobacillus notoginsengisoli]